MIQKLAQYKIQLPDLWLGFAGPEGMTVAEIKTFLSASPGLENLADADWDAAVMVQKDAVTNYAVLPDWVRTGTAADAEAYITNQIWNGMTLAQVQSYIDTNVVDLASAKVALKQTATAVITMRGLFILTAKLLMYVRDLVIRFRS